MDGYSSEGDITFGSSRATTPVADPTLMAIPALEQLLARCQTQRELDKRTHLRNVSAGLVLPDCQTAFSIMHFYGRLAACHLTDMIRNARTDKQVTIEAVHGPRSDYTAWNEMRAAWRGASA